MTEGPFPGRGPDGEEPEGSLPQPDGGNGPRDGSRGPGEQDGGAGSGDGHDRSGVRDDGSGDPPEDVDDFGEELPLSGDPEQGLFLCVPAGNADLSGFAEDGGAPAMPPGPVLAGITSAVAGGDGAGLAGVSEEFLFSVMSAGRRMSSWGTWLELSARPGVLHVRKLDAGGHGWCTTSAAGCLARAQAGCRPAGSASTQPRATAVCPERMSLRISLRGKGFRRALCGEWRPTRRVGPAASWHNWWHWDRRAARQSSCRSSWGRRDRRGW